MTARRVFRICGAHSPPLLSSRFWPAPRVIRALLDYITVILVLATLNCLRKLLCVTDYTDKQRISSSARKTGLVGRRSLCLAVVCPLTLPNPSRIPGAGSTIALCTWLTCTCELGRGAVVRALDAVVVSPGIALSTPATGKRKKKKGQGSRCELIGAIELFARRSRCAIIAITGSQCQKHRLNPPTVFGEMAAAAGKARFSRRNLPVPRAVICWIEKADLYAHWSCPAVSTGN